MSGMDPKLRWHVLGGNNKYHIGANSGLCVYTWQDESGQTGQKTLLFDAGILPGHPRSPEDPALADSDVVIPDYGQFFYKVNDPGHKPDTPVDAIFLTHDHPDHMGAVPFMILQNYKVPNVYATPYTAKRLQQELSNAGIDPSEWPEIYAIAPGKPIAEGPVSVTAFWVSHSTPQSAGFFIETPKGNILHPGDFKTDQSVLWGPAFNETEFRRIASKPVDLLLLDSTGSEKDTAPVTEEDVRETLRALVKENANKRLIVAVMSGYEETLASVAMVTAESDRTLWIAGSAHEQTLSALADTGMSLSDHLGRAADVRILGAGKATRELAESPPRKSVVVVTGAQGHANAVLTRAADGHYPAMQLNPKTDVIIICAPPMPGQEGQREKLLATLRGKGFKVLTRDAETALYPHAHARLSEIVDLVKMADPKNILPIHGSGALRKSCAEAMGKAGRKVVEADNGDVLDVSAAGVLSVNPPTKGNPCLIGFKTLQGANNWRDRHYLMTSVPGENPSAEKRPANGNRKYRPTILNIKKS